METNIPDENSQNQDTTTTCSGDKKRNNLGTQGLVGEQEGASSGLSSTESYLLVSGGYSSCSFPEDASSEEEQRGQSLSNVDGKVKGELRSEPLSNRDGNVKGDSQTQSDGNEFVKGDPPTQSDGDGKVKGEPGNEPNGDQILKGESGSQCAGDGNVKGESGSQSAGGGNVKGDSQTGADREGFVKGESGNASDRDGSRNERDTCMASRSRSMSLASDYSLVDIPENSMLDHRELGDSTAGNCLENIKLIPRSKELTDDDELISCKRTDDKANHHSSSLGSSFVVLSDPNISNSYSSLDGKNSQQTKVQMLPPNDSTEESYGGFKEVNIKPEDWKTNEDPNSMSTNCLQSMDASRSKQDWEIFESKKSNSGCGLESSGDQRPEDFKSRENKINMNVHDSKDGGESQRKRTGMPDSNKHSDDSDISVIEADGESSSDDETCNHGVALLSESRNNFQGNGEAAQNENKIDLLGYQVKEVQNERSSSLKGHHSVEQQNEQVSLNGNFPFTHQNDGSSQCTELRSRTNSSESVEITMNDPIVSDDSTSSDDRDCHKTPENNNSRNEKRSTTDIENKLFTTETHGPEDGSFVKTEDIVLESNDCTVEEKIGNQEEKLSEDENPAEMTRDSEEIKSAEKASLKDDMDTSIEEITQGISSMAVGNDVPKGRQNRVMASERQNCLEGSKSSFTDRKNNLASKGDSQAKEEKCPVGRGGGLADKEDSLSSKGHSPVSMEAESTTPQYTQNQSEQEFSSYVVVDDGAGMKYEPPYSQHKSEDDCVGGSDERGDTKVTETLQPVKNSDEKQGMAFKKLKRSHGLTVEANVQYFKKHKPNQAEVKSTEIPTVNELVAAKWKYVLNRDEKLRQHFKKFFPETCFTYDESYQKISLFRYNLAFEDEKECDIWLSEVITFLENQVQLIDSYLISCNKESLEGVIGELQTAARALGHVIEVDQYQDEQDGSKYIIVTGPYQEAFAMMLQLGDSSLDMKLFKSHGDSIIPCTICKFPLTVTQHHVFTTFDGLKSITVEYPSVHVQLTDDSISLVVDTESKSKFQQYVYEQFLKYKAKALINLKPVEFTLLCKASVKDYVVNSIGNEIQYRWMFKPEKGEIIIFAEDSDHLDEIRDSMFSAFKEHKIEIDNEFKDTDEETDVTKTRKWTELVSGIRQKSNGMAEVELNSQQSCVTITGTSDIMESWVVFKELEAFEKQIDCFIVPVRRLDVHIDEAAGSELQITIDIGSTSPYKDNSILRKFKDKCKDMNLDLKQSDSGLSVRCTDMSEVNHMRQFMADMTKPTESVFIQMDEELVDEIIAKKMQDLKNFAVNLNVEFDPTEFGFEIRGWSEDNVQQFHDHLLKFKSGYSDTKPGMFEKTEACADQHDVRQHSTTHGTDLKGSGAATGDGKPTTKAVEPTWSTKNVLPRFNRFVKLDSRVLSYITKYKMVEIEEINSNINVDYKVMENGFEISGNDELNVGTLVQHVESLDERLCTEKVTNIPRLLADEWKNLQEEFKCLITLVTDGEDPGHAEEGDAQLNINGVDLCVTISNVDEDSCEILVKPVIGYEADQCKWLDFQEKIGLEEVRMLTPAWIEESCTNKMADVLDHLFEELNSRDLKVMAYPLMEFTRWPLDTLTEIILKTLADFMKKTETVHFNKVYLSVSDEDSSFKVVEAIDAMVPSLKRDGLAVSSLKRSAVLTAHRPPPVEEVEHDITDGTQQTQATGGETLPTANQHQKSKPGKAKRVEASKSTYQIKPDVVVKKGELAKQTVDAIVNTTSQDFNLNNGAVSKTILTAAGKDMQKEIYQKVKGKKTGDVIVTKGYKLQCRYVFHGALSHFNSEKTSGVSGVKCMENFVNSCLHKAHEMSLSSIAFPVLGAGALGFPAGVVAAIIQQSVTNFRRKYSDTGTSLSVVSIVVYRDEGMYLVFKRMADNYRESLLRELQTSAGSEEYDIAVEASEETFLMETNLSAGPLPAPASSPQGISLDIGSLNLSAGLGDVTREEYDGLIMLWPDEELQQTPIDKETILESIGKKELKKWDAGKSALGESKIIVTPGGGLPQGEIIHVYVDGEQIHQAFRLALTEAEKLKLSSVVIPVRPTDKLAKDVKKFSACIYRAAFELRNQLQYIKRIRVCIGGKHLCQPILENLAKVHESGGQGYEEETGCTVEVTAMVDDLPVIIARLKPVVEEPPSVVTEECGDMERTLTTEDVKCHQAYHGLFLTNASAEVCTDIIEIARQWRQLEVLKGELLALCDEVTEQNRTWILKGSMDQLNKCLEYLKNYCAAINNKTTKLSASKSMGAETKNTEHLSIGLKGDNTLNAAKQDDTTNLSSSKPIKPEMKNTASLSIASKGDNNSLRETKKPVEITPKEEVRTIPVDMTENMYNSLMFLCKVELKKIIGTASMEFINKPSSICLKGTMLPSNVEDKMKEFIDNFQSTMDIDVVDIPLSQLQGTKVENVLVKLQTENPSVYLYRGESRGAEATVQIYIVALSRDDLKSVKQGIKFEYMKPSNRSGRFSQSITKSNPQSKRPENKLTQSISHGSSHGLPPFKTYKTAEGLVIKVYMSSILQVKVDCIVNAANGGLLHGGGIAAVISKAAGTAVHRECQNYVKSYGPIQTGDCCVTNAGQLPFKRIIHAVGPQYSSRKYRECCELLQQTVERCIIMANKHHMKSVAIPSISAGLYGMPGELCARCYAVAVMTVSANGTGHWGLKEVHFVDNLPDMVFKVQAAFSEYFDNSINTPQGRIEDQFKTSLESYKGDSEIIKKFRDAISSDDMDETLAKKTLSSGNTKVKQVVPGHPVRQHDSTVSGGQHSETSGTSVPQEANQGQHSNTWGASVPQGANINPDTIPSSKQTTPCLVINSGRTNDHLPASTALPAEWKVTVRNNCVNISVNKNLEVIVYERDFCKMVTHAIAFGEDFDFAKSSLIKEMRKRSAYKLGLDQIRTQLPNPKVGTVAMFETMTDIYVQKVFVVFTPKYPKKDSSKLGEFHDHLYNCYMRLFHEAASNSDIECLAVTFLKTGGSGTSFEDGANVFFHAVNTWSNSKSANCGLKQIYLVVNKDTNALQKIKSVLKENYEGTKNMTVLEEKVDKETLATLGAKTITPVTKQSDTCPDKRKEDETGVMNEPVPCAICLEMVEQENKCILEKCKHEFCKDCIEQCFKHKPVCPTCGAVYGVVKGNQPAGTMKIEHHPKIQLPGFPKRGEWCITYNFPNGTQTSDHTHPGKPYRGTTRIAYLPDNKKGTLVKDLLKVAFDRKLVFTIGHSRTTGEENVVTWNDIHHKTSRAGGPQGFGYPDPDYLDRVLDELKAKGVTQEDLR